MSTSNTTIVRLIQFTTSVLMRPTRPVSQRHTLAVAYLGLTTMLVSSVAVAQ